MRVVFHLGAHRTGSTLVEQSISATTAHNDDVRISIWTPSRLRAIEGFAAAPQLWDADGNPSSEQAKEVIRVTRQSLADDFESERVNGTQTLILSEENMIGSMRANFLTGRFYARTDQRQKAFARLIPFQPDILAMGLRNYADVWSSARNYSQAKGADWDLEPAQREELVKLKRGWPQVVKSARATWPGAGLILWRQEDLKPNAPEIVGAIARIPADCVIVPGKRVNSVSSGKQLGPIFRREERKILDARYKYDVARLRETEMAALWVPAKGPE